MWRGEPRLVSLARDLNKHRVVDHTIEKVCLNDDGRPELAAGAVAVRPIDENDFAACHTGFR
jgi:hypothetical protein